MFLVGGETGVTGSLCQPGQKQRYGLGEVTVL